MVRFCIILLSAAAFANAQATRAVSVTGTRTIQAIGSTTLLVNPDQASLDIGVVTTAATAQDSAAQNATQTTAVIIAIKTVLGNTGTVQTLYYSVSPRYVSNTSTINGYVTSYTVRVVTTDLSILGRLIDVANGAGANTVGGLSFSLRDPEPSLQQALSAATKQAMAHAAAIAAGLGGKVGDVVSAQEGSSYSPIVAGT